jgi:RimJ/RimL family protein N-acetyltransferase
VIDTPRLRLRPLAAGDAAFYRTLYTDAELMRTIGPPLDAAAIARSFAAALRDATAARPRRWRWVIVEAASGAGLGLIGLLGDGDEAELGALVRADHQGRGIAAEAIATLARHAFDVLGLRRLHTRHAPANAAAAGLMRKCGFAALPPDSDGQMRWELVPSQEGRKP